MAKDSMEHKFRVLEPGDWDERPESVCPGCGYKVTSCTGRYENCVRYVKPK